MSSTKSDNSVKNHAILPTQNPNNLPFNLYTNLLIGRIEKLLYDAWYYEEVDNFVRATQAFSEALSQIENSPFTESNDTYITILDTVSAARNDYITRTYTKTKPTAKERMASLYFELREDDSSVSKSSHLLPYLMNTYLMSIERFLSLAKIADKVENTKHYLSVILDIISDIKSLLELQEPSELKDNRIIQLDEYDKYIKSQLNELNKTEKEVSISSEGTNRNIIDLNGLEIKTAYKREETISIISCIVEIGAMYGISKKLPEANQYFYTALYYLDAFIAQELLHFKDSFTSYLKIYESFDAYVEKSEDITYFVNCTKALAPINSQYNPIKEPLNRTPAHNQIITLLYKALFNQVLNNNAGAYDNFKAIFKIIDENAASCIEAVDSCRKVSNYSKYMNVKSLVSDYSLLSMICIFYKDYCLSNKRDLEAEWFLKIANNFELVNKSTLSALNLNPIRSNMQTLSLYVGDNKVLQTLCEFITKNQAQNRSKEGVLVLSNPLNSMRDRQSYFYALLNSLSQQTIGTKSEVKGFRIQKPTISKEVMLEPTQWKTVGFSAPFKQWVIETLVRIKAALEISKSDDTTKMTLYFNPAFLEKIRPIGIGKVIASSYQQLLRQTAQRNNGFSTIKENVLTTSTEQATTVSKRQNVQEIENRVFDAIAQSFETSTQEQKQCVINDAVWNDYRQNLKSYKETVKARLQISPVEFCEFISQSATSTNTQGTSTEEISKSNALTNTNIVKMKNMSVQTPGSKTLGTQTYKIQKTTSTAETQCPALSTSQADTSPKLYSFFKSKKRLLSCRKRTNSDAPTIVVGENHFKAAKALFLKGKSASAKEIRSVFLAAIEYLERNAKIDKISQLLAETYGMYAHYLFKENDPNHARTQFENALQLGYATKYNLRQHSSEKLLLILGKLTQLERRLNNKTVTINIANFKPIFEDIISIYDCSDAHLVYSKLYTLYGNYLIKEHNSDGCIYKEIGEFFEEIETKRNLSYQ